MAVRAKVGTISLTDWSGEGGKPPLRIFDHNNARLAGGIRGPEAAGFLPPPGLTHLSR